MTFSFICFLCSLLFVLFPSCPLGGAGHRTVPLQELQDGLRGPDQSVAGGPAGAASRHGILHSLSVLRQRLVRHTHTHTHTHTLTHTLSHTHTHTHTHTHAPTHTPPTPPTPPLYHTHTHPHTPTHTQTPHHTPPHTPNRQACETN